MQFSSWKSTMPLAYWTMAPGEGQALRQPGSSQCMQPSLRISHSRLPLASFSYSEKRITVQDWALRSVGLSYTPAATVPTSSRRSFHSMQAVWQALQPMHLETSISLATSPACAERALGEGVVVAERRLISRDCNDDIRGSSNLLDLDQEGLELGGEAVAVPHERRQRVGQEARLGQALETPVDGDAHVLHGLALDLHRLDALGHQGHGLDVAPLGADLDHLTGLHPHRLGQAFADLDKLLGLRDRVEQRVLGPVVEMLGEAVGGTHVRELLGLAEGVPDAGQHARGGAAGGLGVLRVHGVVAQRRVEGLVVGRERPFIHALARKEAGHPFGVHDEGAGAGVRAQRGADVRYISPRP